MTVDRRVRLALGRFGRRVQRVTVRLAALANPLGGSDQRCRMRAWLQGAGDVRAEAINGKIEAAIARAATRLATAVAWALDAGPIPPTAISSSSARTRPAGQCRATAPGASLRKRRPGAGAR